MIILTSSFHLCDTHTLQTSRVENWEVLGFGLKGRRSIWCWEGWGLRGIFCRRQSQTGGWWGLPDQDLEWRCNIKYLRKLKCLLSLNIGFQGSFSDKVKFSYKYQLKCQQISESLKCSKIIIFEEFRKCLNLPYHAPRDTFDIVLDSICSNP